ncbi:hypothetical protein EV192_108208 [Actinocrispum wychmicini]|uniref:Uncharacterized protein n=2 Tax=Actinocrispum wychmicini TaxID=1213861 RepID=A0A4V6NNT4_9PSEU|nr:hypothetical protein EV192_108208 [Actinocrispum wychmicini]
MIITGVVVAVVVSSVPAMAAPTATVTVSGDVASARDYSGSDLVALGQRTYPVPGTSRTVTGTSLLDLVVHSAPVVPPGKNTQLRVGVRVTGKHGRSSTFALGELDPGFGAQPAVLTTDHGIDLVLPGDNRRDVMDVRGVNVFVDRTTPSTGPGLRVVTPHRTVVLPAWLLAHLPARTVKVTFLAGTTPQTHTEKGPSLAEVLLFAGVLPTSGSAVTAVGDDGYGAMVTLGERRPLLLSTVEDGAGLAHPQLIPDGDVKGGRYVSGVVTLSVR